MNQMQVAPPVQNPTLALKGVDTSSIPDVTEIGEQDFKRFVDAIWIKK